MKPTTSSADLRSDSHLNDGQRFQGHVKWYDKQKGFGFIVGDDGREHFLHRTGIAYDGSPGTFVRDLRGPEHSPDCPAKRDDSVKCTCGALGDRVSFRLKPSTRGSSYEAHGTQKLRPQGSPDRTDPESDSHS